MRLLPLAPESELIRRHYESTSKGGVASPSRQQGWGILGSRAYGTKYVKLSNVSGGPSQNTAQVKELKSSELAVQRAKSQLGSEQTFGSSGKTFAVCMFFPVHKSDF